MGKFADVLEIKNGKNQRQVENPSGQYPIYGSGGIMGYADDYICEADTVIIGRKGTINNPIYVKEPFWNVDTAFGLVAKRDILFPKYLYYFCERYDFEKLNTTVTIPSLTKSNLLQIEIPLPPLPTQQKIADILDRAGALIEKRKAQIEKLDLLVKSQFIEMFGDPVTNSMGWGTAKLSEVTSKIGSGATPKGGRESYIDSGISLIRSMNVHNGYFKYDELAHITDKQAKQLENVNIQENDVLLNITGASVARSCLVPLGILPARVNQHVSIIRCDSNHLSHVFSNAVFINDSYQRFMLSIGEAGGATRQAITKQQIENFMIILPPIPLQSQFAAFVERIEAQKVKMKRGLELMELEYKSLMQKCFNRELY